MDVRCRRLEIAVDDVEADVIAVKIQGPFCLVILDEVEAVKRVAETLQIPAAGRRSVELLDFDKRVVATVY